LGTAADCLGAQGIWVILANALNGIQLQKQLFQMQVVWRYFARVLETTRIMQCQPDIMVRVTDGKEEAMLQDLLNSSS
jgi:hypothetical protein